MIGKLVESVTFAMKEFEEFVALIDTHKADVSGFILARIPIMYEECRVCCYADLGCNRNQAIKHGRVGIKVYDFKRK